MSKRRAVTWMRPLVGAQHVDVVVGDTGSCHHLDEDDEGSATPHKARVEISSENADSRKIFVLGHEVFGHVVWDTFELKENFRSFLGLTDARWEEFEEKFAREYVAAMMTVMLANDWLRLPPLPRRARSKQTATAKPTPKKRRKRA